MSELPTEKDIGKALNYLAETDQPYAQHCAHVKALEYQVKTIKALVYLESTGTVEDKTALSESSEVYRAWVTDYEKAYCEMKTIDAKRKRADLTIEVWRSLNANRRQGA